MRRLADLNKSGSLETLEEYEELLKSVEKLASSDADEQVRQAEKHQRNVSSCWRFGIFLTLILLSMIGNACMLREIDPRVYAEVRHFEYALTYDHGCDETKLVNTGAGDGALEPYIRFVDLRTGLPSVSGPDTSSPPWAAHPGDAPDEVVQFEIEDVDGKPLGSVYHFSLPILLQQRPFVLRTMSLGSYALRLARVAVVVVGVGRCDRRVLDDHDSRVAAIDYVAVMHRGTGGVTAEPIDANLTGSVPRWLHRVSFVDYQCDSVAYADARGSGLPINALRTRVCTPTYQPLHEGVASFAMVTWALGLALTLFAIVAGRRAIVHRYAAAIAWLQPEFLFKQADIPGTRVLKLYNDNGVKGTGGCASSGCALECLECLECLGCIGDDDGYSDVEAFLRSVISASCPFFVVDYLVGDPHGLAGLTGGAASRKPGAAAAGRKALCGPVRSTMRTAWSALRTAGLHWAVITLPGLPLALFAILLGCERDNEFVDESDEECGTRPTQEIVFIGLVAKDILATCYAFSWYIGRTDSDKAPPARDMESSAPAAAEAAPVEAHDVPRAWRIDLCGANKFGSTFRLITLSPWLLVVVLSVGYLAQVTMWLLLTLLLKPGEVLRRLTLLGVPPVYVSLTYRQLMRSRREYLDGVMQRVRKYRRDGGDMAVANQMLERERTVATDQFLHLGVGSLLLLGLVGWLALGYALLGSANHAESMLTNFVPALTTVLAGVFTAVNQAHAFEATLETTQRQLEAQLQHLEQELKKQRTLFEKMSEKLTMQLESLGEDHRAALEMSTAKLLCGIFEATEVVVPTCFIVLPYKLNRRKTSHGQIAFASALVKQLVEGRRPEDDVAAMIERTWEKEADQQQPSAKVAKELADDLVRVITSSHNLTDMTRKLILHLAGCKKLYLYLVDEVTGQPVCPERSDAKFPFEIDVPDKDVKGTLLPFLRTGIAVASTLNGAAGVARIFGVPVPTIPINFIQSVSEVSNALDQESSVERFGAVHEVTMATANNERRDKPPLRGSELRELERLYLEKDKQRTFAGMRRFADHRDGTAIWSAVKDASKTGEVIKDLLAARRRLFDGELITDEDLDHHWLFNCCRAFLRKIAKMETNFGRIEDHASVNAVWSLLVEHPALAKDFLSSLEKELNSAEDEDADGRDVQA